MADLLRLLQFGDSALPIGGFSFSSGLETATEIGLVHNVETLEAFLDAALRISASGDGVGLVCAFRALEAQDLDALSAVDEEINARKLNEETRLMSVRMGRKLVELSAHVVGDPINVEWLGRIRDGRTPGTHPASLAATSAGVGIRSDEEAFALLNYSLATAILGAALRLMRVSFVETQSILWRSMEKVPEAYAAIEGATLDDMAGFAPVTDILAALHVKGHLRMFMN
ncbi:urease accessory protein [Thiocapsa rosea]|uniref:Urease accessory protein UreF n=2 Tax=Thiocapsa rosea TaxID=69360 RepID=A0A495VFY9_9GAMM|nr:urease accessory protein [Thiocapsa rosea]